MLTALTVAYPSDAALRGLRGFADVAETEGQIDENNANHRAALEWLKALGTKADTIGKVLRGGRAVTASLAYSVARLTDVSIDDLLTGALLSPRTCPHCGHPPDDFVDEETVVESAR